MPSSLRRIARPMRTDTLQVLDRAALISPGTSCSSTKTNLDQFRFPAVSHLAENRLWLYIDAQFSPNEILHKASQAQRLGKKSFFNRSLVFCRTVFCSLLAPHILFGFLAFCFFASSIYIINDYRDIDDDRKHPVKSKRPLASGM